MHRSTCVFVVLVVLVLLSVNLPGQIHVGPDLFCDCKCGPHFGSEEYCEHGWPLAYLQSEPVFINLRPSPRLSPLTGFEGFVRFSAWRFVADVFTGIGIVLVAGVGFEAWRRRRQRLLQFSIRESLVVTAFVAVCLAFFAFNRSQYEREWDVLNAIEKVPERYGEWNCTIDARVEWQRGGVSWLREIVGDPPFQAFDRVVGIDTSGDELELVAGLRHLRVVRIMGAVTNRQLRTLERLPRLEALDMCCAALSPTDADNGAGDGNGDALEEYVELPKLPKLRGLNLYDTPFRIDGLENIPAIEALDLTDTEIDDATVPALAALGHLKKLAISGTAISEAGAARLRQALPDCKIVDDYTEDAE